MIDEETQIDLLKILEHESQRVKNNNNRAERLNLPSTLTLEEWIHTLARYGWRCFYCDGPYEVLEHYIPLIEGGTKGTEKDNCVPACGRCNCHKRLPRNKHSLGWERQQAEKLKARQESRIALENKLKAITEVRSGHPTKSNLERIQADLGISPLELAVACNMSLQRYRAAECGGGYTQDVAMRILETVNTLLAETGKPEVSVDDLGLNFPSEIVDDTFIRRWAILTEKLSVD